MIRAGAAKPSQCFKNNARRREDCVHDRIVTGVRTHVSPMHGQSILRLAYKIKMIVLE
jgi:hypothetical protein